MRIQRLTKARLVLAIMTTILEEMAIYAIWRWMLPGFGINWPVSALIGMMVGWGVFSIFVFTLTTSILSKQKPTGLPSMVGMRGKATSELSPEGMVKIGSELWVARSDSGKIPAGGEIEVVGEDGLKLMVRTAGLTEAKH
jgi:membrane-bound ClpP family serine protease